jgi:hypothetical protein
MHFIAYLVAGLSIAASPAQASTPGNQAKVDQQHYDPGLVEAKERRIARNDVKVGRDETAEEHRKVEKRKDGSMHSEFEKRHVRDDGQGETTDREKIVIDSKRNDAGGRTITRDVTREHDAPGSANDKKTHVKETIEKNAKGKIIKRERSE